MIYRRLNVNLTQYWPIIVPYIWPFAKSLNFLNPLRIETFPQLIPLKIITKDRAITPVWYEELLKRNRLIVLEKIIEITHSKHDINIIDVLKTKTHLATAILSESVN